MCLGGLRRHPGGNDVSICVEMIDVMEGRVEGMEERVVSLSCFGIAWVDNVRVDLALSLDGRR